MSEQMDLPMKEKPKLSTQQRRVLDHLRAGKKNTGYFMRLHPPILKPSNRVGELIEKGYDIINTEVADTAKAGPVGQASYELREAQ